MTRRRLWLILIVQLLGGTLLVSAIAQDAAKSAPRADDDMGELTPGREAAALTFADEHHPELATLLRRLKKRKPQQYEKALKGLFSQSERFARVKGRHPKRYDLLVRNWELESRIKLLAAKSTRQDAPGMDNELQELLLKRVDVRLQLLEYDRNLSQQRADRIEESIKSIKQDREVAAQRELQRLKKSLGVFKPTAKGRNKRQTTNTSTKQKP